MKEVTRTFSRQDFAEAAGYKTPVKPEDVNVPSFAQEGYAFLADSDGNVAACWM